MSLVLQDLVESVKHIARTAGKHILEIYKYDFTVEEKADNSPLTEADLAAHCTIVKGLKQLTPGIPILSEESSNISFAERSSWSQYWLVDPLDGTREFINRNGEFTVNIALIQGHDSVLGVVHVPVKNIDYYGWQSGGSYVQHAGREPQQIHVAAPPAILRRVVGSRSHRGESLSRFLSNLGDHEMIPMGSSLKLCLVAEGTADIYPRLGPTSEWDTAAAHAVVTYAGGQVTDTNGNPLQYNTKDEYLNPEFMVFGDATIDWYNYL